MSGGYSAKPDRCHSPVWGKAITAEGDIETVPPGHGFPQGGVFTAALDAVIVMDADGLVRDWNPSAEDIFGYSWNEAIGHELAELVIPPAYRAAHRAAFRRYLETRQATILDRRLELTGLRQDGSEFPVELTVTRVPDIEPPLFAGFVRDMSTRSTREVENERLQQRLAFLAHAGLMIDVSLDLDETLRRLVGLTVPELAELAVIDLLGEGGSIRGAVAAAGSDRERALALEQIRREHPLDPAGSHPVAQVLRTGNSMLLPEMDAAQLRDFAQSDEHFQLMMGLRYRSAIVVPLPARGRLLGALSLLRMQDESLYDQSDLLLAETLGRRAALALENARLYASTRHIARTLQQSLLPRAMPEIPCVHMAARYRAAAEGQDVGGDFYDAFQIGEQRWGIAIGDVCGKGPEAAALTALARYTIRAVGDRGPSQVLSLLNEAVLRDEGVEERFLTALFAELTHDEGNVVLEIAAGGHPPPFLVPRDGAVQSVAVQGSLIGVVEYVDYEPARVELREGDKLVLYTDGLADARAPKIALSEDDVARLIDEGRDLEGQELAQFLESRATGNEPARDDIAILVLEAVAPGAGALSVHYYTATS
ncbi:MAG TPA: SpoIIE family protein phosphatase [Thermoleophilaceae bacterium]|nr:SpoIIE family protein phosphatase [Thermoleophilaceae bacterium]